MQTLSDISIFQISVGYPQWHWPFLEECLLRDKIISWQIQYFYAPKMKEKEYLAFLPQAPINRGLTWNVNDWIRTTAGRDREGKTVHLSPIQRHENLCCNWLFIMKLRTLLFVLFCFLDLLCTGKVEQPVEKTNVSGDDNIVRRHWEQGSDSVAKAVFR